MRAVSLDALVVTHAPNVRYLTGFTGTAGLVLLTQTHCLLVVDFRYAAVARSLASSDAAGTIDVVVSPRSYDETLVRILQQSHARRIGIEAAWMPVSRFNRLSAALAATAPTPLESEGPRPVLVPTERLIERARLVKDADEIATMREAGRRIARTATAAAELARPGRTERQIAAGVDTLVRDAGFERPAFETIVASGPNSALPHARPGDRVLQEGDGVVLDFGGVYDGYCVDLTRTVQLGDAGPEFRRLFEAVADAHTAALAAVRPAARGSDVDRAARVVLEQHGLGEAFGHGTGHGLGLEVHEEPRLGLVIEGQPDPVLEPGMVFTVEPGAYLEGVGGVRIEDDVLVTRHGYEVLTRLE
jgi:Xaa-Pro aminopeptidase